MTAEDYFNEIIYGLDFSMEKVICFHMLIWECVQAIRKEVWHSGKFRFGDNSELSDTLYNFPHLFPLLKKVDLLAAMAGCKKCQNFSEKPMELVLILEKLQEHP